MFLYDFLIFYTAGQALWRGASPYAVYDFVGPLPQALLFMPLALLPLPLAYALYLAFNLYLLWRLLRKRMLWALLSFPVLFSLFVGQVDLPLALAIGAVPWLLPLALIKPQIGFVLAPWLLRRYTRPDWLRALALGLAILGLSFALRPGWVGEWLAAAPAFRFYSLRASNLYYLIPDAWNDARVILSVGLAGLAFLAAFFMRERKTAWTAVHLFAPLSAVYSASVLAEWIGPLEMAASWAAVILAGGNIHDGMPMYFIGLLILARPAWPPVRRLLTTRPPV